MTKTKNVLIAFLLTLLIPQVMASEPLPPDEAFKFDAAVEGNTIRATWTIADDYYMYREKFHFESATPGVELGTFQIPKGKLKHGIKPDGTEGEVETYMHSVSITVPILKSPAGDIRLIAHGQGCAEKLGICYPPQKREATLSVAAISSAGALGSINELSSQLGLNNAANANMPLPAEQAFQYSAIVEGDVLIATWTIAPDYYMYKDKFAFEPSTPGVHFGKPVIPKGKWKHGIKPDGTEGEVETFMEHVTIEVPIIATQAGIQEFKYVAHGQGCAESLGICYPPIKAKQTAAAEQPLPVSAQPPPAPDTASPDTKPETKQPGVKKTTGDQYAADLTTQERFAKRLEALFADGNLILLLPALLAFGLLLAFTACMYPMIPIVSSIIVGQGEKITASRGFLLSLIYVLAVAVTFGIVGAIMGFLGEKIGIQRWLQEPAVLYSFALLFIVLSLSMFGFYNIQVPSFIQSKLTEISGKQKGGTLVGVAVMGVFSALVIGPCGGPILLAVMAGSAASNSILFGFLYMFLLGLGMGLPLLVVGAGGGSLLPKAGTWMDTVKAVAGVILIVVALYFVSGIMNSTLYMLIWSALLIVCAVYMGAFSNLPDPVSGWRKLWKGLGLVLFAYGVIVMLGGLSGARNVTDPLHGSKLLSGSTHNVATARYAPGTEPAYVSFAKGKPSVIKGGLTFIKIKTVEDVRREIDAANKAGHTVMLDFYADWCVYCIQFDDYVFSNPDVQQTLSNTVLLQADITANDDEDNRLTKTLDVPLPPAILFFRLDGKENRDARVTGIMDADKFAARVKRALN